MNSSLILLAGGLSKDDPEAPSNQLEPYRVIWNPQVMLGNISEYVSTVTGSIWQSEIKTTDILTDHDPMENEPVMLASESEPVENGFNGYPMIGGQRPVEGTSLLRINSVTDFAHPDRRNRLPKVFQVMVASSDRFPDLFLMKYSLNTAGTKYVSLRATKDSAGQISGYISICLDGSLVMNSASVNLADIVTEGQTTDSIRMIIFGDKVDVHISDPGTEVLSMPLPEPLTATTGAHFDMFLEDGDYSNEPENYYAIDGLYIYDGYY